MTGMHSTDTLASDAIEAALVQGGFVAPGTDQDATSATRQSGLPGSASSHATSRQPVMVAAGDPLEIVWANPAACALFGVATLEELTDTFRHGTMIGTPRLMDMATHLQPARMPPAPPRLERLRFLIGALPETITFMVRTLAGPAPLVVFAASGVRSTLMSRFPVLTPLTLKPGPDSRVSGDANDMGAMDNRASDSLATGHHRDDQQAAGRAESAEAPETGSISISSQSTSHKALALAAIEHESAMPPAVPDIHVPPVEEEIAPVIVAPRSVAAVRADLNARFGDTRILRFLWQTDREGHLTWITEHLQTAVGATAVGIVGKDFSALAAQLGLDPQGSLRRALASRVTWSRVQAFWPVEDSEAALPVSFGALPALTRDQKFSGFQGYGVIHLQCPTMQIVPPASLDSEPLADPATADPVAEPATDKATVTQPSSGAETLPDPQASHQLPAQPMSSPFGENVIQLHAGHGGWRFLASRTLNLVPPAAPPDSHILPLEDAFTPPVAPAYLAPTPVDQLAVDSEHPGDAEPAAPRPDTEPPKPEAAEPDAGPHGAADHTPDNTHAAHVTDAAHVVLSLGERMAFGEIARTLGAMRSDVTTNREDTPDAPQAEAPAPQVEAPASRLETPATTEAPEPLALATPTGSPHPSAAPPPEAGSGHALELLRRVTEASETWNHAGSGNAPTLSSEDEKAVAAPSSPGADALQILDHVPTGLLLVQDGQVVHVNTRLLNDLDYADMATFRSENGLAHMFKGRAPEAVAGPDGGAVPLVTRNGAIVLLNMGLAQVTFAKAPAQLLTFHQEPDLAPRTRLLEADLRKSEADARQLQAILDTATDGVAVLDEDGKILSLNKAGQALFGYEQNDVVGHPFTLLLQRDSETVARDYFAGIKANGVAAVLNDGRDVLGRAHQGGAISLFMTIGPIGTSAASTFCAVLRDMTAWKRAERELRDANREAERASALKSEFLAKVSHEIRTPLNAILGFTEVMMEERLGTIGNARYKEYLSDIHASGSHVMSLVNDLLDLSKIESGKMDLASTPIDANRIINECVSLMQLQANAERVIVRMSLAPRLPAILTDERSLRQIVLNLLSNAVKFNEPGGQVIISTALTDAGHAVIRIRDTGIGMNEADLEIALEPFRQVSSNRSPSGTGLGLPLTKALVEANRASFSIKSRRNEGTLVEVAFPPNLVLAG